MRDFGYFGNLDIRYEKEHYPIVEYVSLLPDCTWKGYVYECELVFLLEGSIRISNGYADQSLVGCNRGIFLIPGRVYEAFFCEATSIIRVRLDGNFPLKDYFHTDKVELMNIKYSKKVKSLLVNDKLKAFLYSLYEECQSNAVDSLLAEIKRKELFHILYNYYQRQDILSFLYPLFSDNYSFMSFVYNNYRKVNSVYEFAHISNYSLSAFCGKFRTSFGISAYKWMMKKRNYTILNELITTTKQVKLIAEETGFSSPSQFCDYCKKHFGMTTNEIRKKWNYSQLKNREVSELNQFL